MANKKSSIKNSEFDSEVFSTLKNLFGDVLHVDVIQSVALNCKWNLATSSNILAELSCSVTNERVVPKQKQKKKSIHGSQSSINSIGYAGAVEDDNDVDVLIEEEQDSAHGSDARSRSNAKASLKARNQTPRTATPTRRSASVDKKRHSSSPKQNQNPPQPKPQPRPVQNKSKKEIEYDRIRSDIRTGARVLVLLRGLPGSGKSHLAKMLVTTTVSEDYRMFVFSTDDYFLRNGVYTYNPIQLADAHGWNQRRVMQAMQMGISPVVVDNTNTQIWEMKAYAMFAVQFGYAIEILEPLTVWIFNPPELARRNTHNVPLVKIKDMLERYEKNIKPADLFARFDLRYMPNRQPPQPRMYPPLRKNIQPLLNIPVGVVRDQPLLKNPALAKNPILPKYPALAKNPALSTENCPNQTVLAAGSPSSNSNSAGSSSNSVPEQGAKKKRTRNKKTKAGKNSDSGSIGTNESINNIAANYQSSSESDDDSEDELSKSEIGHTVDVRDIFFEKTDLLSGEIKDTTEYVLVMPDNSTICQKDHGADKQNENIDKENVDLINFNDFSDSNDKTNFSTDLINLENDKESQDKSNRSTSQTILDICEKFIKTINLNDTRESKNSVSERATSDYPKIDLSSWGLTDDALISWEVVDKPLVKQSETNKNEGPQPQRQTSRQTSSEMAKLVETSTNTSSDDFNLLKEDYKNTGEVRIIHATSRNIGEFCIPSMPRKPARVLMLDKGTMTGRENILAAALTRTRCNNEAQHFSQLVHLFPNIEREDLQEIFDKCQGDINWAVDVLLDSSNNSMLFQSENSNTNAEAAIAQENQQSDVSSEHVHSEDCACVANYDTQSYVPTVSSIQNLTKVEHPTVSYEVKRCPEKSKNKVTASEESLQLKKQLEEQFKISDAHYSEHVLNVRKKRHGEFEPVPSTSKDNLLINISPTTSDSNASGTYDNEVKTPNADFEDTESEGSSEEEMIEMNVGVTFIEQLEKNFGCAEFEYPKGFQPVMQMPASLGRQLHAFWVESVYHQMEAQANIIEQMVKQDEEFARKLQEKEAVDKNISPVVPDLQEIMDMEIALAIYRADQEQWKKETPDDLASRMKRQKLFETFPHLDQNALVEILLAHGNSFDQTVEVLLASTGRFNEVSVNSNGEIRTSNGTVVLAKQKELIENAKKEYVQAKESHFATFTKSHAKTTKTDESDGYEPEESATYYREQAAHHLKMRQLCYEKAQQAFQKGMTQVASYYSEVAKLHKQKYEHANSRAATALLSSHSSTHQNDKTLDLHYLYVREAEQALAMFIDNQVSRLQANKKTKETLFIITGRGSHSRGGISHIKPAVKKRLKERNLGCVEMNPGLLKVIITKHSIMTNDLK